MPVSRKLKSKPKPKKKSATSPPRAPHKSAAGHDFPGAFAGLKAILAKHAHKLKVTKDLPDTYYLDTHLIRKKDGYPIFFGAVIIKKNYVSFHFMAFYCMPEMIKNLSPELKKRMQGKACFNFTAPDPVLFAELDAVASKSFDPYHKYLESWTK